MSYYYRRTFIELEQRIGVQATVEEGEEEEEDYPYHILYLILLVMRLMKMGQTVTTMKNCSIPLIVMTPQMMNVVKHNY